MNVAELYKFWSEDPYFDEKTRAELLAIRDDEKEIEELKAGLKSFQTAYSERGLDWKQELTQNAEEADFIKNLANTNPKLQGLDLDNLEGTAQALCQQNNIKN